MMNQQQGTNKQSIIGFILITIVFAMYMIYTSYQQKKYNENVEVQKVLTEEVASVTAEATTAQESPALTENKPTANNEATSDLISDAAEDTTVTIENDVMQLTFASRGAQLYDVVLKDYTKYAPKKERNQLVHLFDPSTARFDFSLYLKQNLRNVKLNTSEHNFEILPLEKGDNFQKVTFRLPVGEDASINLIYTLYNEMRPERDYLVDLEVKLHNLAPLMANQTSIGVDWSNRSYQNERSFKNENQYTTIAYRFPGEVGIEDLGMSTGSSDKSVRSSVDWISFKQQYFSSTIIARSSKFAYADLACNTAEAKSGYVKDFAMRAAVSYTPQTEGYDFSFYLGPNKYSVLHKVVDDKGESLSLERIIPLGWIISTYVSRWVVIPLFDFLSSRIASFGLIILIMTILIKLAIFPLTYKSYLSTAKMRVLKPEIDAINAKYPRQEDAMKKQQATMELYKKADINMMGGCLPMLIQMPILIAMLRFFPASIELRGQSFLWSDDLSAYDSILDLPFSIPFYGDHVSLFCLLMTICLFTFSYINYKQTASSQPQMPGMKFMMVYMMPAMMMLFMFNDYSSGLCYYYLLSNLFTIAQTIGIRYLVNDNKVRAKIHANISKNTNGKKSRFQQKYEVLVKKQEELKRQQGRK